MVSAKPTNKKRVVSIKAVSYKKRPSALDEDVKTDTGSDNASLEKAYIHEVLGNLNKMSKFYSDIFLNILNSNSDL